MLSVGLTGGVACGKSTVAAMFVEMGAYVVDADRLVHELYRKGERVYHELVKHFGEGILGTDGEIDRARLAALAFDGGRVQELNRIVHPAVGRRQREWISEIVSGRPDAITMVEAALILEAGGKGRYDKIIVVTCAPEQKVARYAARTGLLEAAARAEVERRSKAQMSDSEKAGLADYVIDNSGALEASRLQVEKIFAELKPLAQASAGSRWQT
jgi:dephospho-CoA kinase